MLKRIISCALSLVFVFSTFISVVSAVPSSYSELEINQTHQMSISSMETQWYSLSSLEDQYYKFIFHNQSVEARTGIGIADFFLNLFAGKISVTIYDQYDERLASFDVKCGYSASISLKLSSEKTYYYSVNASIAGNYTINISKLADIGSNTWQSASSIEPSGVTISAIDAAGDKDWYVFTADDVLSYYYYSLESIQSSTLYFYLYEYVEGAGDNPLRSIIDFSVGKNNTNNFNTQLKPGFTYYICISSTSSGTGGYVLTAVQSIDAVGNQMSEAYEIERDVELASSFDGTNDNDWYRFTTADFDAYYHITLTNNTNKTACFSLYAEDNTLLIDKFYIYDRKTATKDIKLLPNTSYYLKLWNYDNNTGSYVLNVTTNDDPAPDSKDFASPIERDTELNFSFDGTNDIDWYKFNTADFDAYYHITLTNNTNKTAYFSLYAEDNTILIDKFYIYDRKTDTKGIKLLSNTTYYLKLWNYDNNIGSYVLNVTTVADIGGDSKETAYELTFNKKNELDFSSSSDVDWFKINIANEDTITISILNESCSNVYCTVYSARDSELLRIGGDTKKEYVGSIELSEGTYFLKVYPSYGAGGYYTLWIRDSSVIPGDFNNDFVLNAKDVIALMKAIVKGNAAENPAADFNGDGKVNSKDVVAIMKYIIKKR